MMDLLAAARDVGGTVTGISVEFSGVSTDSRGVAPGELFVALHGERFDGHAFLAQAGERGAVAAMVDAARAEALVACGLPLLAVDDTRLALGRLAAAWRRRFELPLIAITGSNGKTTVKEMVASILRMQASRDGDDPESAVLATHGNFNNDIGLPLTLLKLRATHRAAVIEMGMNRPGEIAALTQIAAPTVSVVNNAQRAHLAGLGSLAGVAREKGTIIAAAPADTVAVVNADDEHCRVWQEAAGRRRLIRFALDHEAEVRGRLVDGGAGARLSISVGDAEALVDLPVPGRHNACNALAAAAAGIAAGIALPVIAAGLEAFRGVPGRLQPLVGMRGARVIDDTYNANPDSVRAGLDVLAAAPGRRILVFGDMGEIGADAGAFHEEVGAHARRLGIEALYALGANSARTVAAFGAGGEHFADADALVAALLGRLDADATVLIKGSRFMRMERVVDAVRQSPSAAGERH